MRDREKSGGDPAPEQITTLAPGIRRVLAPNPSPMTFHGTNTYIVGDTALAVIDPGPADHDHLKTILSAVAVHQHVAAILVTHSHRDHSPLATALAQATGAPVCGYGPSDAGRSPVMAALGSAGLTGGGEGVDPDFSPSHPLDDGATFALGADRITALWTPGHMANHLCFAWRDALFCGDLVMGWASTMVSPPDGDLAAFYHSCARLRARPEAIFYPGHGDPIIAPTERIDWLVAHRRDRERQILSTLSKGPADIHAITRAIYADVNPALLPAAARNVLAHLIDLHGRRVVEANPALGVDAVFALAAW